LGFVEDVKSWFGSEDSGKRKKKSGKWAFDSSRSRKK